MGGGYTDTSNNRAARAHSARRGAGWPGRGGAGMEGGRGGKGWGEGRSVGCHAPPPPRHVQGAADSRNQRGAGGGCGGRHTPGPAPPHQASSSTWMPVFRTALPPPPTPAHRCDALTKHGGGHGPTHPHYTYRKKRFTSLPRGGGAGGRRRGCVLRGASLLRARRRIRTIHVIWMGGGRRGGGGAGRAHCGGVMMMEEQMY